MASFLEPVNNQHRRKNGFAWLNNNSMDLAKQHCSVPAINI